MADTATSMAKGQKCFICQRKEGGEDYTASRPEDNNKTALSDPCAGDVVLLKEHA
jgi:hypothetical protein